MSELERIAARLFWWKSPREALADPRRFLAQVMVYGTAEDVVIARRHFDDGELRNVLADPPPGLFDPRSWAYWHVVLGLEPAGEPPRRRL
jgi:hypothetical protein